MSNVDGNADSIAQQLDALSDRAGDLLPKAFKHSAYRVYREAARLARSEHRLIPLVHSLFHQIHLSSDLLDLQTAQERAVELLSFLESEDNARAFQPDFDQFEYNYAVSWMTACAYELLAEATGQSEGYNSEGMHACLSDGIEVCRRTGKLSCIGCFREFGTEVYRASDDANMAMHFARIGQTKRDDYPDRGNCRYISAKDEAWTYLLHGHLQPALEAAQRANELVDEEKVSLPWSSRLGAAVHILRECSVLAGQTGDISIPTLEDGVKVFGNSARPLPKDEHRVFDVRWDMTDALIAGCKQDFATARGILEKWDRWLSDNHCFHLWFEVRLRLLATRFAAGEREKLEPLVKQLEERAWKARDWLTLRRLARLLDESQPPTLLALLEPLDFGPFSAQTKGTAATEALPTPPPPPEQPPPSETETTPLQSQIEQWGEILNNNPDEAACLKLRNTLLAFPKASVTHPVDAARLLHLMQFLAGNESTEMRAVIWNWAESIASPFPKASVVINFLATIGDILSSGAEPAFAEQVTAERIENLFRESLDLDPFHAFNHFRAGLYYFGANNLGEAERCLARGFRLDRTFGPLAVRLADVYNRSERPRDALMVLDSCLREGCQDPNVAWEAGVAAFNLEQFEPMMTYLEQLEQLQPGGIWVHYFRAIGHLEMGKPQEALAAVEEETRRAPEHVFVQHALRACCKHVLGNADQARQELSRALDVPLVSITYLTMRGIATLYLRLWKTIGATLPQSDKLRQRLEKRLLAAGIAPDQMFDELRQTGPEQENVNFYRCRIQQPLDDRWPTAEGCLPGQEQWQSYFALWGVLACSEEEAQQAVMTWQKRCADTPPIFMELDLQGQGFKDKPGVVWQGERWPENTSLQ